MSIVLRPSNAPRWMNCAGAPTLVSYLPEEIKNKDDSAAEEGTAAHWVALQIFKNLKPKVGDKAFNGWEIDQDMLDHIENYVEIVDSIIKKELFVECTIPMPFLNNEGTPDVYSIDHTNKIVHVIDLKYGFNAVEPENNWQLICYAYGIMQHKKLQEYSAHFHIYQPRAPHIRGHLRDCKYDVRELDTLFGQLLNGAKLALSNIPFLKTGSHCKYCEAINLCPAAKEATDMAIEIVRELNVYNLNAEEADFALIQIEDALETLKIRRTGLESEIMDSLKKGRQSSLWELDRVKPREKWKYGMDGAIIAIGKLLGKELTREVKALTPAQCRKLKIDEDIINKYSVTPLGELKLVKANLNEAKKLFGN